MGLAVVPVKAQGLEAARGATDFGEYFVYFSFFLMVSALLLTGLFFKLGVEQRMREIGVLRALGFSASQDPDCCFCSKARCWRQPAPWRAWRPRWHMARSSCSACAPGGSTRWAPGCSRCTPSIPSLAMGAAAGVVTGLGAIAWTLRGLQPVTPRGLLAGERKTQSAKRWRWLVGAVARSSSRSHCWPPRSLRKLDQTAGFFGAGTLLLIAALLLRIGLAATRAGSRPSAARSRWACAAPPTARAAASCASR